MSSWVFQPLVPASAELLSGGGGTVTPLSFNYTTSVSVSQSNRLVKLLDLFITPNANFVRQSSIVYKNTLAPVTAVGVNIAKLISKGLIHSSAVLVAVAKKITKPLSYATNAVVGYADIVQFNLTFNITTSSIVSFSKSFIGGGISTVATLLKRGRFIMNHFGRW